MNVGDRFGMPAFFIPKTLRVYTETKTKSTLGANFDFFSGRPKYGSHVADYRR